MEIQDNASRWRRPGVPGHGAGALSAGLGTVIEVDRPDVFRFPPRSSEVRRLIGSVH